MVRRVGKVLRDKAEKAEKHGRHLGHPEQYTPIYLIEGAERLAEKLVMEFPPNHLEEILDWFTNKNLWSRPGPFSPSFSVPVRLHD